MSDSLLAGMLVPEKRLKAGRDEPDYLLLVDKRTAKPDEEEPSMRTVHIKFGPGAQTVTILSADTASRGAIRRHLQDGRTLQLRMAAGEGVPVKVN